MSVCVTVGNQYGNLKATKTPVADCQEYVLISAVDYQEYKEPVLFNGDLFLYVSGVLLINMVVGHWVGRVVRLMSKR
ncbi:TPA: hypothetical protein I7275_17470 [Vibrio parahaemolyticus]|uniref:hypothetical protein n=1 Tax=Vibrio parahaemolyticus TaxID=670 RepID=UPI00111EDA65|nr:hypothetical protein [Vibrio parahaemolyticus]MDF4409014.1 hypothetical protein [Vibrio parahaemolyticus]TOG46066.1 hypothetical protein CGJ00_20195 [Vibrio parahaemolyticus]TOL63212.1 hypothetical protein CGH94_22955 [Vibrio parahaemolyticus]HAS6661786.1 hypothetical protein [Vibrio parahaemolyticus]HAS6700459.1 hypothetical protein [Vibrio parahaemolyticus]